MDLMKLLIFLLGFTGMFSVLGAQEIEFVSSAAAAGSLDRLERHALLTMENYYYFMQGVDPAHTSAALDRSMALAQDALLTFEQFTLRRPQWEPALRRLDGYWTNIRTRCVHTPRPGGGKIMVEHYREMESLIEQIRRELHVSSHSQKEFLRRYKRQIHYLSLLYILYQRTADPAFKTLLDAGILELRSLNNRLLLWMENSEKFDTARRNRLIRTVREFLSLIADKNSDPDRVYGLVQAIDRALSAG